MYRFDPKLFNPQQREAVLHSDGPMLVLAGAGSGKTRIIAHRVAQLVHGSGVAPSRIVALSFTNKAANEMKSRVAELIGETAANAATISTFHSMGANILRHHLHRLGWVQPFAILDETDQRVLLKNLLKDLNLDGARLDSGWILQFISRVKARNCAPLDMPGMRYNAQGRTVAKIFEHYQLMRKNMNAVDFDDLIVLPHDIFESFPDVLAAYHEKWHYFLVDEYQDTNAPQFRLLRQFCALRQNLMVVGDDDQSIYAFRGADSSHILQFPDQFEDVKIVSLEQNYRSTPQILTAANAVIAKNATRHAKVLWSQAQEGDLLRHFICKDEDDEVHFVIEQIKLMRAAKNARYGDFAILYRSNMQSRPFEIALSQEQIAYRIVGGSKLYDRREVKDLLCYLRVIWSTHDSLAVRRIVNSPRRGITAHDMEAISAQAKARGCSFYESLKLSAYGDCLTAAKKAKILDLISTIERYSELFSKKVASLRDLCEQLMESLHYFSYIQSSSSNDAQALMRKRNIEIFLESLDFYEAREGRDLFSFLQRVALEPPQKESDDSADELTLMTLHSSKGLEFPYVFMVGCEEGLLPHANSLVEAGGLEEERRLCYVGITRAKRSLTLSSCSVRQSRGEAQQQKPSRYIKDIPMSVMEESARSDSAQAYGYVTEQEQRNRDYLKAAREALLKSRA
ncbi:MAG: ATP-dependent helicase [Bradymonadia bacterium]|jgi:DNA helicase-2/ATP-dependent DNA helicase PcrA